MRRRRHLRAAAKPQFKTPATPKPSRILDFLEKVAFSLLDKGLLGLGIVLATALVTTRLETIKAKEAQSVETTKRQIEAINRVVSDQLAVRDKYLLVDERQMSLTVEIEDAKKEERQAILVQMFTQSPDEPVQGTTADRLWLPATVRSSVMSFASALSDYARAIDSRADCIRWQHQIFEEYPNDPSLVPMRMKFSKHRFNRMAERNCFWKNPDATFMSGWIDIRAPLNRPWTALQASVDDFIKDASHVPSLIPEDAFPWLHQVSTLPTSSGSSTDSTSAVDGSVPTPASQ